MLAASSECLGDTAIRERQNGSRYAAVIFYRLKKFIILTSSLEPASSNVPFQSYPVSGVSHQVRAMIQKSIFLNEVALRWKVVRHPLAAGILAVTGLAALLVLIIEMDGSIPDPPIATQKAAPAPFAPAAANGLRNADASIDREGRPRITDRDDATRIAEANATGPGAWLINDVAKTRARAEVTQSSSNSLPATAASADARAEARVESPSSSDTRAAVDEQGPGSPAGGVARVDTSRAPDDTKMSCLEAPVGQAPDGKRWYYRLDRDDHRKCWYLRSRKHEASSRGSQRSRVRRTWVNWRPWDIYW
jgi:hypothetical protein